MPSEESGGPTLRNIRNGFLKGYQLAWDFGEWLEQSAQESVSSRAKAVQNRMEFLRTLLFFTLVLVIPIVVFVLPVKVLTGETEHRSDSLLGVLGLLFWVGVLWFVNTNL